MCAYMEYEGGIQFITLYLHSLTHSSGNLCDVARGRERAQAGMGSANQNKYKLSSLFKQERRLNAHSNELALRRMMYSTYILRKRHNGGKPRKLKSIYASCATLRFHVTTAEDTLTCIRAFMMNASPAPVCSLQMCRQALQNACHCQSR